MSRDPDEYQRPEVSEPVTLDEIHEVLGAAETALEGHRWPALGSLSLYAIALGFVRLLESRERKP